LGSDADDDQSAVTPAGPFMGLVAAFASSNPKRRIKHVRT
jgi:hypothetical protein